MRGSRHLLVAAIYAIALSIAVLGLDFGHHWDELKLLNSAAEAVRSGLLLPRWYNYPSASFDLVMAATAPEGARVAAAHDAAKSRLIDDVAARTIYSKPFRLRVRAVFAALALLAVVWTYWWALSTGESTMEALFAAGVLACSWEVGYHARWIAPDAVLMQFAAATMAAIGCALRAGALRAGAPQAGAPQAATQAQRWLDVAAVTAGLGFSTKYPGGILVVAVLLASFQLGGRLRDHVRLAALFFAAFLATSPGVALEPGRFIEDLSFEIAHYRRGHGGYSVAAGLEHGWLLLRYLSMELLAPWEPLALALFVLTLLGAVHLLRHDRRTAIVIVCVPVLYLAYMSTQRVLIVRNYLLLAPFFAVLAARGAAVLVAAALSRVLRLGIAWALAVALAASVAWQVGAALSVGGREPQVQARNVNAYLAAQPQRRFALSPAVERLMSRESASPGANVVADPSAADSYIFDSSEVHDWTQWIANRAGTYQLVSGPSDVNFDYYPTWAGPPRVLAISIETARRMKVVEPSGIEPPTS